MFWQKTPHIILTANIAARFAASSTSGSSAGKSRRNKASHNASIPAPSSGKVVIGTIGTECFAAISWDVSLSKLGVFEEGVLSTNKVFHWKLFG